MTADAAHEALNLFHQAYRSVPAYADFIRSHHLDPKTIKSPTDFKRIPPTDKKTYINRYPLNRRLYKGKHPSDYYMISASSGSTGQPTFWPRDFDTDTRLEEIKEALFEEHFHISRHKTLCLITFGLGVWTAGMLSAKLSWPAGKHHRFTVMTPGIDKQNALSLIKNLHSYYDQIILLGYPPFLTDLIEAALEAKLDLPPFHLKLFYTSEHVSPQWKQSMAQLISKTADPHCVVGFYACSDTGIIAAETKTTISISQLAARYPKLNQALFGSSNTPSFASYNPHIKYLESVGDEILITADQPVPLIRYNIHDRGNLLDKRSVRAAFRRAGRQLGGLKLEDHYVYVFGRSDAVKVTANVYIEDIKYCLEQSPYSDKLTGHFRYGTIPGSKLRYRLKIIIFLKPGHTLTAKQQRHFETTFYDHLLEANDDFKMIQSGTKIEKFLFEYLQDPSNKFATSKLKYFL